MSNNKNSGINEDKDLEFRQPTYNFDDSSGRAV
jgi:hypothetical protein